MVFAPFLSLRSSSSSVSTEQCVSEKVKQVRRIVCRKGPPLSAKQEEFCDEACIVRFLKAKGNHVKKAAKQLRATLTWRAMLDIDSLTADEFPAELASGTAYVAGQDEEGRPVLIVRLKPDDICTDAPKRFLQYLAFTMEVSIACMPTTVNQCVLILDASFLKMKSSSPPIGLSVVVQLFKLLTEHYPQRLAMAFIVDAPPMFHLLWKGIRRFLDLKMKRKLKFVSSRSFDVSEISGNSTNCRASSAIVAENPVKTTRINSKSRAALMNWTDKQQMHHIEDRELIREEEEEAEAEAEEGKISQKISKIRKTIAEHKLKYNYPHVITRKSYSVQEKARSYDTNWVQEKARIYGSAAMAMELGTNSAKLGKPRSLSFTSCRKESESVNINNYTCNCRSFRRESSIISMNSSINGSSNSRRWLDFLNLGQSRSVSDADSMNMVSSNHNHNQQHQQKQTLQLDFGPYYQAFLIRPYHEASFRSLMKPPLGGLISILSTDSCTKPPHSIARCRLSVSL